MKSPLRLARELREMTIVQVSIATGIDPGNLSRIERGCQTPSKKLAEKLSNFFDNEVTEIQILYPERFFTSLELGSSHRFLPKVQPPEIPPDLQTAAVMLKGLSGKFADEEAIAWFLQLPPKNRAEIFEIHDCITTGLCIEELNRIKSVTKGDPKDDFSNE